MPLPLEAVPAPGDARALLTRLVGVLCVGAISSESDFDTEPDARSNSESSALFSSANSSFVLGFRVQGVGFRV